MTTAFRILATIAPLDKAHDWEWTSVNAYGVIVEERCRRCGAFRHHLHKDLRGMGEEPIWREGMHPDNPGRK